MYSPEFLSQAPKELSMFELLDHEQYDHENIGTTSENIKPEIMKAAKELLSKLDKYYHTAEADLKYPDIWYSPTNRYF